MIQQEFFSRYSYDIRTDKIGGGAFGTVYMAEDNVLHRKVAIKVSEVKSIGNKEFSLKDEFEAIKDLPKHPNIANYEELHTFESPQGLFDYAVMQYYEDGNLSDAIKNGLSENQKEQIAIDLLQGIMHLHKHNVVHRDLKPGNILIVKRGEKIIPVITDFGLSKQIWQEGESRFSNSFGGGTLKYSSPEQLRGEELRMNTDLWSYGVIVYQVFTATDLFSIDSNSSGSAEAEKKIFEQIVELDITEAIENLPNEWQVVIKQCLVRDSNKRVRSAIELSNSLHTNQNKQASTEIKAEETSILTNEDKTFIDNPINNEQKQVSKKEVDSSKSVQNTKKPNWKKWVRIFLFIVFGIVIIFLIIDNINYFGKPSNNSITNTEEKRDNEDEAQENFSKGKNFEKYIEIVNDWNDIHNTKDLDDFYSLYASTVNFYQTYLSRNECISKKASFFEKHPDFKHYIEGDIKVEEISSKIVKCSFNKKTILNSEINYYPSYLYIEKIKGEWLITTESDLVTDENLRK